MAKPGLLFEDVVKARVAFEASVRLFIDQRIKSFQDATGLTVVGVTVPIVNGADPYHQSDVVKPECGRVELRYLDYM